MGVGLLVVIVGVFVVLAACFLLGEMTELSDDAKVAPLAITRRDKESMASIKYQQRVDARSLSALSVILSSCYACMLFEAREMQ